MTGPRPPQPPFPPPRGPSGTPLGVPQPVVPEAAAPGTFRRTLVRVMAMQVVALALLWLLQARYTQ
jgi:hypothetical protein